MTLKKISAWNKTSEWRIWEALSKWKRNTFTCMPWTCKKTSTLHRLYLHHATKGGLGNHYTWGTWDNKPTQCSLTQCKSRYINQLGSYQSLQGVQHVLYQGHIVCLLPDPSCPALNQYRCLSWQSPESLRGQEPQGLPLNHKLHVLILLVTLQLLSIGQLFSILTKESRTRKPFLCYLRKSKWSSSVFALLHKVR